MVIAACLDLFFFTGYYASDDQSYFEGAARIAETGALGPNPLLGATRLTVMAWNILFGWMSRFSVQFVSASYILSHLILILLNYVMARKVGGPLAGLIAAWTAAVFPLFTIFSSSIYPDFLIAIAFVLSVLSFMKAYELRARGRLGMPVLHMFLCGIWVGVAYMAKENGLVGLPFYFLAWITSEVHLWRTRHIAAPPDERGRTTSSQPAHAGPEARGRWILRALLTGAFFPIGFFTIFGAENKALIYLTGDPSFTRLGWTEKEEDLSKVKNFHIDGGYKPWDRFVASQERLSYEYFPRLLKWVFTAALLIYPFVRPRSWVIYFFGLWFYAFSTWGTYSFSHYYPPRMQARYYIPAFPFIIAVFGISLAWALERTIFVIRQVHLARLLRVGTLLVIVLSPLTYLRGPNALSWGLYRSYYVRQTQRAIAAAAAQDSPLTVLSQHLVLRLRPLWYRGCPEDIWGRRPTNVMGAEELASVQWGNLLSAGFFYYVEMSRHIPSRPIQPVVSSMDQLLAPAIHNDVVVKRTPRPYSRRPALLEAESFACLTSDSSGVARIDNLELRPQAPLQFDREFISRSRELFHLYTCSFDYGPRFVRSSTIMRRRGIAAYRVDVKEVHLSEPTVIPLIGPGAAQAPSEVVVSWRLSDGSAVAVSEPGGMTFKMAGERNAQPVTIEPDISEAEPDIFKVHIDRRYRISLKMHVPRSTTAMLIVRAYDGGVTRSGQAPAFEKSIPLASGINDLSFFVDRPDCVVIPSLSISGEGTVRVETLNWTVREVVPKAHPTTGTAEPVSLPVDLP